MLNFSKLRKQKGFTLIEILVVVGIIAVLAFLGMSAIDTSRSKAQSMIALGKQVSDGSVRFKNDTGCYPLGPTAMFDGTVGQAAANNTCNRALGASWNGPYLAIYPVSGTTTSIIADKVSSGVVVSLGKTGTGPVQYYVRFSNVPQDIVKQALQECNNDSTAVGSLGSQRCAAGNLSAATTTFDMLYDTTR